MSAALVQAIAAAWRIVFLVASAPAIGAVLLLAIGRVTGARWEAVQLPPIAMRLTIVGAALLGLAQLMVPLPLPLALWMHPLFVGFRAVISVGLLAFVGARLRSGASATFAALTLALYATLVTPVATDWLLGGVPGHAVSAAGMMLFCAQIAAACAVTLLSGRGEARLRDDMAKLMVAAALGLGYLAFVDYLIIWFGNLPARVGFYAARGALPAVALTWVALVAGLAVPIAALATGRQRLAGGAVLVALVAFDGWWVGGGVIALLVALAGSALVASGAVFVARRGAHG